MPEENPPADSPPTTGSPPAEPNELQVINGGVDLVVTKIDASTDKILVRQLPVSLLPDYADLQGNEAELVELLCDKQNRANIWRLGNSRATEIRLLQILQQAKLEQVPAIEKEIARVRSEIEQLEKERHWSDSLTEESLVEILDWGEKLNEKRLGRWAERRKASTGRTMKTMTDSLLAKSPPPVS